LCCLLLHILFHPVPQGLVILHVLLFM
jgi:hypothetical protein